MDTRDSTKRIPKSIGTEAQLFGTYTMTDVAVGLLPGVIVLLVMQVLVPTSMTLGGYAVQSLTLPVAALAIAVGGLFVYLTPPYTTSVDWLATFAGFHRRTREHDFDAGKAHTQLERIHPREDVFERTDGALVGMIQVTPPTMALATDEQWQSAAKAFQNFLNTTVEFPIQIFSTTQEFPTEEYVGQYEERLDDPDVRANPRLEALIEHYVAWYETELRQRKMTIRDHYIVVPVTPAEVQFEHESLAQQLARLPVLGLFVQAWFAPRLEDEREAMFAAIDERLRRIQVGIREIEGCTTRRVDVGEMTAISASYWNGTSLVDGDMDARLRTRPIVGGRR